MLASITTKINSFSSNCNKKGELWVCYNTTFKSLKISISIMYCVILYACFEKTGQKKRLNTLYKLYLIYYINF